MSSRARRTPHQVLVAIGGNQHATIMAHRDLVPPSGDFPSVLEYELDAVGWEIADLELLDSAPLHAPGLYVWSGVIVNEHWHTVDANEYETHWDGVWRPATLRDLAVFEVYAELPVSLLHKVRRWFAR